MIPNHACWYANFANSQKVIVFNEKSNNKEETTKVPWYDTLLDEGMEFGHTHKDKDQADYRTLLVWQLAERHYQRPGLYNQLNNKCGSNNIFNTAAEKLDALDQGRVDYAFEYLSVALQHKVNYLTLPAEIDLSKAEYADNYLHAKVLSQGKILLGEPIINALTIPRVAVNFDAALAFVKLFLGSEGQNLISESRQIIIFPPQFNKNGNIPTALINLF